MKKDIALLIVIILAAAAVIKGVDIQSVDEYYSLHSDDTANASHTVTLTVDCSDILDNYDMLDKNLRDECYVPSDGIVMPAEKYVLREGDTAFDLLEKATRCEKIPLDYQGSEDNIYNTVYVRGINNIYEFSCGPSSGWTYTVNGESPDKGCSQYVLHDGDSVDVLVTVSESSAAFYRDMPEQVLFDSVSFPVSIPDAEEAFHAISFDDIDGDGESDVLVRFLHKSGDTTEMIWIWDPVERYVFREDLSTVAVGGALSSQPYFTRNGLQINAAVEMGTFLLEDGVCSYSGLGDGYNTDDCYWEIVKNGDYTHDGIRELHFDAICYIPEGAIPYFDQQYITVTSSELYDYYTGTWLTASTAYGNSQRGENYYLYTISWQGSSYLIEFAYSTEWEYNVSDWAQVLTKSYVVYIPEDYNGLIFAAEAQPLTYKESAKRMQLDSICPEAAIMDIDTLDPYSCLFFDLCD